MKILIVDDDPEMLLITIVALENGGFEVTQAGDPSEALTLTREHRFDAVLLDYSMPGMDGPALLEALKVGPLTADVPLIVMTGKTDSVTANQLMGLGARGVVSKPFDPWDLPLIVRRLMG